MKEMEFNLLEEPWVRVLLEDYTVREVSLKDALLNAEQYIDLAGEVPTQDIAVLRLLLAILHTVFSRWMQMEMMRRLKQQMTPWIDGKNYGLSNPFLKNRF